MYTELHSRSAFSFLEGASVPEKLVEVCAHLGMPAMALLDRDGVYGSPRLHLAATKAGIKAHIGAEVTCNAFSPQSHRVTEKIQNADVVEIAKSVQCHPERSRTMREANRPAESKDSYSYKRARRHSVGEIPMFVISACRGACGLRRRISLGDLRAQATPAARTIPKISRPIGNEAVAAGEGTFNTCKNLPRGTNRKSSTRFPSGPSACARTPDPPGVKSSSRTSGTSLCNERTNSRFTSDRRNSRTPYFHCRRAKSRNPR
jgi:hypothetical protein